MPPSTQERIARVLLRVGIDKPALTDTKNQIDAFNKTLADLERQKSLSKLATDSARAVSEGKNLRVELGRMKAELVKFGASSSEVSKVVREFDRLRDSAEQAANASTKGTGNKLLRSFGTDLKALPALPIPGTNISTDVVGKIINTLGRLDVSLKDLIISGGLAAGAVIAISLAFQKFIVEALAPIRAQLSSVIAAQQSVAGLLAENNPQAIVDAQKAALQALNVLQAQRNKALEQEALLLSAQQGQQAPDWLQLLLGGAIAEPVFDLLTSEPIKEVQADITDYNAKITEQQTTVSELNKELERANRLLEAERVEKERLRLLDLAASAQLQATLQAETSSAQAIRDRIDSLNFEQAAILKLMRTNEISVELSEQLTQRSRDINASLKAFSDALPEKERLEAARALFDKLKAGVIDFAESVVKTFKDLKAVSADIGEIKSEFKAKIADIQNKLLEQLIEADRDRNIALSEARRDADIAAAEAVRSAGLERVEIERDSQLAIQKILRRSKVDINNAIQDRDAVALDAARTRRDLEVSEEERGRAEKLRQLDIGLKEELRTIDMRLKEQNRTIDMRYQEQVRRAQQAAEASIRLETEKYNKELALKTQEISRILQLEQQKIVATINGATAALGITANFWQNMVTVAQNAVKALGTAGASVVRPAGNPSSGGARIPSLDTGGRIMSDGLIYAHKGEYVTNPRRGQGQGQIVFAPQINGMGKAAVRREILRQFDQWEDEVFG